MNCDDETKRLIDLTGTGLLKVCGPDAKKLLQGQLTCNLDAISETKCSLGAHCNPQGRVISFFCLMMYKDAYYLVMPASMIASEMAVLKKYAVFYKTEISDASDSLAVIGYVGTDRNALAESINDSVCKIPVGQSRLVLIGESDEIKHIWQKLAENTTIANSETWKYLDMCDGLASIYPETTGKFLPHELRLPELGAVSFDKGCYTGQEIIARMHYRGKLKKHLYQATIAHPEQPPPGADVFYQENETIKTGGVIVDASLKIDNIYHVLVLTDETNIKPDFLFLDNHRREFITFL